jgi:hypothetical protein
MAVSCQSARCAALAVNASRSTGGLRWLRLVRQPHLVMFEVLSLVVALFGACLVGSSPVRPVVGVAAGVGGVVQGGPEAPDFVAGQRDEVLLAGGGAPF